MNPIELFCDELFTLVLTFVGFYRSGVLLRVCRFTKAKMLEHLTFNEVHIYNTLNSTNFVGEYLLTLPIYRVVLPTFMWVPKCRQAGVRYLARMQLNTILNNQHIPEELRQLKAVIKVGDVSFQVNFKVGYNMCK